MDVSTVRWWVARLNSGDSGVKDNPPYVRDAQMSHYEMKTFQSVHPRESADYDQGTVKVPNIIFSALETMKHWAPVKHWVTFTGVDFYEHSMQALVHCCQGW